MATTQMKSSKVFCIGLGDPKSLDFVQHDKVLNSNNQDELLAESFKVENSWNEDFFDLSLPIRTFVLVASF